VIGVKTWIYKGEVFDLHAASQEAVAPGKPERAAAK
jgi:ribosomal protein S3